MEVSFVTVFKSSMSRNAMLLVSLIEKLKYWKYSVSLEKCLNDSGLMTATP
jgi:hypothetical protein